MQYVRLRGNSARESPGSGLPLERVGMAGHGSGADMAAYTASLTAQAPFVRTAMQKQLSYKKAFTRVIKQAIATAVDFGRLPEGVFEFLDIQDAKR